MDGMSNDPTIQIVCKIVICEEDSLNLHSEESSFVARALLDLSVRLNVIQNVLKARFFQARILDQNIPG